MHVFHRIDDIRLYSEPIDELIQFFDEYTEDFFLAVIPEGVSEKCGNTLCRLKHGSIWQHGYEHIDHVNIAGQEDEFPETIKAEEIRKKICRGNRVLVDLIGAPVDGYVPPYNRTSKKTVSILREIGFKKYSAVCGGTYIFPVNKDVSVDIVLDYGTHTYKDLDKLFFEMAREKNENVGILYHFFNLSEPYISQICAFVRKIEAYMNGIK